MIAVCVVYVFMIFLLKCTSGSPSYSSERKYFKCLICQRVVEEMSKEILSVSPSLNYKSVGYVLDVNEHTKPTIELRRSDLFLVELMERLCEKLDDYVRVYHKETGQLDIIPLIINGHMNPVLHSYEIIKDGDLESLEFYCESIMSEYDEEILQLFKSGFRNIESSLCFETELCRPMAKIESNRPNPDLNEEL